MELGTKVKMRREELGWSQDELAQRMGYKSRSSINKIEMGRPISQKIIFRLAEVLNVKISYLMGISEEEKKDNDIMADIIVRMRMDKDFLSVVETLNKLEEDKFELIKQMLNAFSK